MNEDIIKGKWNEIRGAVQAQWGRLTDDDLDAINGERIKLMGRLQTTYGIARDEADKQIKDWEKTVN